MRKLLFLAIAISVSTLGFSQSSNTPTVQSKTPTAQRDELVLSSAETTKEEVRQVISVAVDGIDQVLSNATQIFQVLNEPETQEQIKYEAKKLVRKVNPAEVKRLSDFLEELAREIEQEVKNIDRRPQPNR